MSKKFKRLLKNIRFSVELEVEFPNTKDSQKLIAKHRIIRGWAIDYDGSLSNGAEYRPKDRNKLFWNEDCFDQIKEIIGLIKAHRGKIIPTTCGLHVHIDMSKFSNKEIINIIKLFIKKQPKIFRQFRIIPSRKDYAQRIPKKASNEVTMDVIKKLRTHEQLQYEEGFIGDRHYALNVLALNAHSTLEWRIFNGSLKINKIKEAIKFALQFCIKHAKG